MKLKDFLSNKIKTGLDVEYSTSQGKNGKVIIVNHGDDKYVLGRSIENFHRFRKWPGEKSVADIKKTGKFHKTEYGFLPIIEIRTIVKVIDDRDDRNYHKINYDRINYTF
jgi:hypothetical protein